MALWYDLPGLLDSVSNATGVRGEYHDGDAVLLLRQHHQADVLLLSVVIIFLVGSYLVCRYCRCRWLRERHTPRATTSHGKSHGYTQYKSSGDRNRDKERGRGKPLESVVTRTPKLAKSVLVGDMEEPFLGPPDYEQPPPYEPSPPAYDYLPSAPPLSDGSDHSSHEV